MIHMKHINIIHEEMRKICFNLIHFLIEKNREIFSAT